MSAFSESIIARAISKGILDIKCHQIRDYTLDRQGKVDDYPYGGGPGLVMSYQPVRSCYDSVTAECGGEKPYTVYMSPQGTPFTQKVAKRLSEKKHIVIICGHYEGMDERVIEDIADEEISMGDFVLTGGEIPAMALADCVSRLVPGVLAKEEATVSESHTDILLEYPQYTRPEEIAGMKVPDVLLNGNHKDIEEWRLKKAEERTEKKRPDLYRMYRLREQERKICYLDNSATTRQSQNVTDVMNEVASFVWGNPSSLHRLGFEAEKALRKATETVAGSIGADEKEIYFTSGATESNNWVMRGICPANPRLGKHIIVSAIEHPSVLASAKAMESLGYKVDIAPVGKNGVTDPETVASMVRDDTVLVSVMHVNSETGAIQPVAEISRAVKKIKPDILVHSDCVQSYCKIPVNVTKLGVDMLSVSGHKFHGPRGIGFLYVRKGVKMAPLLYGGGQMAGNRSGTENLPAIAGMARAAEDILPYLDEKARHAEEMRNIIREAIESSIHTYVFNTDFTVSSPYIMNVSFPGIRAEVLLHTLEESGVYVSVGSACSSHKKDRSTVLKAMGVSDRVTDGAIRISFSALNTVEQAEYAGKMLVYSVKRLYAAGMKHRN